MIHDTATSADLPVSVNPGEQSSLVRGWFGKIRSRLTPRGAARAMTASFATVAMMTLVAKGISFLKDAAVAQRFGAGAVLDTFLLSFGLVSFAASVLAGGLPEAFLPLYSELKHRRGPQRASRLAVQCTLSHLVSLAAVAGLLFCAAPLLASVLGRGFDSERQKLAANILRALLPFMICYGLSVHLATWLRAGKSFAIATITPALVPLAIIACLLAFGKAPSVGALIFGTNLGALLTVAALAGFLIRGLPKSRRWWWRCLTVWEPGSRRVLANTIPFLLSGVIFSSSTMVDQAMATWLSSGSVVVLCYSDKICGLVLGLTAAPASDALFPYFAEAVARQDWKGVRRQMFGSAGTVVLIAVPMTAVLCILAPWIVHILFERGAFDAAATQRVATVLRFAALQIPFFIAGTLLSSIAVSMQAARLMLVLSVTAMVANAALDWLLMQWLGVAGIALATALVHLISTAILFWWVMRALAKREVASS